MGEYELVWTGVDSLSFDKTTGRLMKLTPKMDPRSELVVTAPDDPAFALQYLRDGQYVMVDSFSAASTDVRGTGGGLVMAFRGVGGLDIDVTIAVTARPDDPLSRWRCKVRNGSGLPIVDVQFPFVVVPDDPSASLVRPFGFGEVWTGEQLQWLGADEPRIWQFLPDMGNSSHYPGSWFAQFLAWYAGRAGLYLACEDTEGNVKRFSTPRRENGIRLGVAHVGDWPLEGERTLEYETVLGSFAGDWYDAAERYRSWSLKQSWATPLTERTDVPGWLLDSPPHITIRLQGYLDDGPAPEIVEFLPYEKCILLLQGVADAVKSPLVAVMMSWERGGPWVYPDCFPPVGGDQSMANFCALARERGWQVGSFCNGTRWVMGHKFNGYDGKEFFARNHGADGVCRLPDGELWTEGWDGSWRPSYGCCMAADATQRVALNFVEHLLGWGMTSIQFFDQNVNAAAFPCFGAEHGHPGVPGKWMPRAMEQVIASFVDAAKQAGATDALQSTEQPCNEFHLQIFQQCDVRVSPPSSGTPYFAPVYHYLFHECQIMHGMMSTGGEPYALPIRNAWNGALGEIPGAVLTGDGTLLNRETFNWANWEPKVGSNEDSLEMIRTVTAMRRGAGRDFLVYGRMMRPAQVDGIEVREWDHDGRHYAVPAIAHAAWQAPDGRHGLVMCNWTNDDQTVTVVDERLDGDAKVHACGREDACTDLGAKGEVTVPALGCVLIV